MALDVDSDEAGADVDPVPEDDGGVVPDVDADPVPEAGAGGTGVSGLSGGIVDCGALAGGVGTTAPPAGTLADDVFEPPADKSFGGPAQADLTGYGIMEVVRKVVRTKRLIQKLFLKLSEFILPLKNILFILSY